MTLDDFDGGATDRPDPPTIDTEGAVKVGRPDGTRVAGRYGHVPERDALGFVTERHSHQHRIRALDAYAISVEAINTLGEMGAEVVLVAETDSGHVYEFELADFTEWGTPVPDEFLEREDDPQRYHKRSDPKYIWRGHLPDLYRHDEPPEGTGFIPASDLDEEGGD